MILVALSILVWLFGGKSLFVETPAVAKNFENAKNLFAKDYDQIKTAKDSEERIQALIGKSENKDIVNTLSESLGTHVQTVIDDNTQLNLAVIALEQMSVPLNMLWAKNRLSDGADKITEWKSDAKNYYELASSYYKLVTAIVEYKDQVANQNFDKQNDDEAMISHSVMKDICDKVLTNTTKISDNYNISLPNTTAYFSKAKEYHEKSIAFYQADKNRDMATEKNVAKDIATIKDELAKLDAVSDLTNFETSYLQNVRATLDSKEQAIERDFISFRNK